MNAPLDRANLEPQPPHVQANNGMLIVDDLGRQRMAANDLITRWLAPVDAGVDHLSLEGGKTATVPFDTTLVFVTNLAPGAVADAACLRRIGYKIAFSPLSEPAYLLLLQRACRQRAIAYDAGAADFLTNQDGVRHGHDAALQGAEFARQRGLAAAGRAVQQHGAARVQRRAQHLLHRRRQEIVGQLGRQIGRSQRRRQARLALDHGAVGVQRYRRRPHVAAALHPARGALLAGRRQLVLHVDVGAAPPRHLGHLLGHHEIEGLAQHVDRQVQAGGQLRQVAFAAWCWTRSLSI